MRHLEKNAVFALALIAAGFFAAWLRFRPYLEGAGGYSDGARNYDVGGGREVRYAIWDPPVEFGDEVNTLENERAPTYSSDGLQLVFACGDSEGESDLWIADVQGGVPRRARPLTELNTASGEIAPAFADDYLYFASNRPGSVGGFDLWRAPYERGVFGAPERLGGGINTSADECDPAPLSGSDELLFSSNRGDESRTSRRKDHDLYRAGPGSQVTSLRALNTEAEERDPALTADGSALFFASDRRGSFDLYRSASTREEGEERFLEPLLLTALATVLDERSPSPSADGFTLTFAVNGETNNFDLWRAQSRELFRKPGRPVGWMELMLLAALLLLALLAKLSTRWSGLEILYKCVLVSLLVHLLLLWWFQHVHPESEKVELERGGPRIRVHLISEQAADLARNSERGGSLKAERAALAEPQLTRAELDSAPEELAQSSTLQLERAARPEFALPTLERSDLDLAASRVEPTLAAPELRRAAEPRPLYGGEAPALEHSPQVTPSRARSVTEPAPKRLAAATGTSSTEPLGAQPTSTHLERATPAASVGLGRPLRLDSELARASGSSSAHAQPRVPRATGVKRSAAEGEVPSLELGSARTFAGSREAHVPRLDASHESSLVARAEPPSLRPSDSLGPLATSEGPTRQAPKRDALEVQRETHELSLDLSAPTREGEARIARADVSAPAIELAPAAFERAPERSKPDVLPKRFEREREAPLNRPDRPAFRPLESTAQAPPTERVATREAWDHTPYQARAGNAKLRALQEHGGSPQTERAVAAGLAYLADRQRSQGNWGRADEREEKYLQTAIGKTGLSMLAFLGAGHTHVSKSEYSPVVAGAIAFLLDSQDERTGHFGFSSSYSHAIATYALAECFALTEDDRLEAPIARAVAQIKRHQLDSQDPRLDGGWGYYYPDGRTFDRWPRASVTVWQVMALESARLGGLEVEDHIFDSAKQFLLGCWDRRREAFRYSHDPERLSSGYPILPGSTPASLFALSILGVDVGESEFGPARTFVLERKPRRYRPRSDDAFVNRAEGNLYFWYYSTMALFRAGGPAWDEWNGAMKKTLLGAQAEDGSWPSESAYAREYAGDTDRDRSYATAMCVLSLEVYYRYFTPLLKVE